MAILLPALALALLAGGVLLAAGWRGRRVDRHRLCRKCGYDLTGTPDAAVCTECGGDLTRRRAVRVGNRRRRKGLLAGGLALAIPAAIGLGLIGYVQFQQIDWLRLSPEWMLRRDLASANLRTSESAAGEMLRRYDAGELSAEGIGLLIADTLDRQADPLRAWNVQQWGGFIERARANGDLTAEQWGQFAMEAARVGIGVRMNVRIGDPLPMRLWFRVDRHRVGPTVAFEGVFEIESASIAGRPIDWNLTPFVQLMYPVRGMGWDAEYPDFHRLTEVPLGTQWLEVTGTLKLAEGGTTGYTRVQEISGPPIATRAETLTAAFVADAQGPPSALTTMDPALRDKVESSFYVSPVWLERSEWSQNASVPWDLRDLPEWWLVFVVRQEPLNVATEWAVIVQPRDGGPARSLRLQAFHSPIAVNGPTMWMQYRAMLPNGEIDVDALESIDLLLLPDQGAAARRFDSNRIWGLPLHFPDLPRMRGEVPSGHIPATHGVGGRMGDDPDQ